VMLPNSRIDPAKAAVSPYMFMDTGVPRLFHAMYNLGADRSLLVLKAAGGAQFLDAAGVFNIGGRNQKAFLDLLAQNAFPVRSHDFGGVCSRTVRLNLDSGAVQIQSPGISTYSL
jgi:chemotaxis protein CheD